MFFYDPTFILLIPALLLSMYAQYKVGSTFRQFSSTSNRSGLTGAEVAQQLLERSGIFDVSIAKVAGQLTDHYDPRSKVLRLSDSVYGSRSISAVGVAAHETGHAVQHNQGYAPLNIRNGIFPVVNIGSRLATPLIILGLLFASFGTGTFGMFMVDIGIILFAAVVVFQLVTLPVEFNASNRAIDMLDETRLLSDDEVRSARKVLNAAALTYVAAAATAALNLLRLILISSGRRRRD